MSQANSSMIRALHHTKIAMQYFEDVAKQVTGTQKSITQSFASKCNWILQDVRHRLPAETLRQLDYELKDSLFLESIETEVLKLNDKQREIIENIIILMNKGEKIEIIDNES